VSWIESHQSLDSHPKTRRAAKLLGVSIPAVIGHLHILWHWALDYAPDGDLSGLTSDEIADGAMWDGGAQEFVDALTNCGIGDHAGFIDATDDGLCLHDWYDYAGKLVERRKEDAARKREARKTSSDTPDEEEKTSGGRPVDGRKDGVRTVPNRTVPNRTTPKSKALSAGADVFESFWTLYPRKEGRGQAKRAWTGALKKATVDTILAGLRKRIPDFEERDRQFIPLPATWLNGERWGDELENEPEDALTRIRNLRKSSGDIAARGLAEMERVNWQEVINAQLP
jgi:hypothetical protein